MRHQKTSLTLALILGVFALCGATGASATIRETDDTRCASFQPSRGAVYLGCFSHKPEGFSGKNGFGLGKLRVALPDGDTFAFRLSRLKVFHRASACSGAWSGRDTKQDAEVLFSVCDQGVLIGHIRTPDRFLRIEPVGENTTAVVEVPWAVVSKTLDQPGHTHLDDLPQFNDTPSIPDARLGFPRVLPLKLPPREPYIIDIAVLYTHEMHDNVMFLGQRIAAAFHEVNVVLRGNDLPLEFRLAYAGLAKGFNDPSDHDAAERILEGVTRSHDPLNIRDGYRDKYGADLVSLWHTGTAPGQGHLLRNLNDLDWPDFVGRSEAKYATTVPFGQVGGPYYTFLHEVGHNFGAMHDSQAGANTGPGLFPASQGWVDCTTGFYTVMAYTRACREVRDVPEMVRLPYFSDPERRHEGVRLGTSQQSENVHTMAFSAPLISAYRPEVVDRLEIVSVNRVLLQGDVEQISIIATSSFSGPQPDLLSDIPVHLFATVSGCFDYVEMEYRPARDDYRLTIGTDRSDCVEFQNRRLVIESDLGGVTLLNL